MEDQDELAKVVLLPTDTLEGLNAVKVDAESTLKRVSSLFHSKWSNFRDANFRDLRALSRRSLDTPRQPPSALSLVPTDREHYRSLRYSYDENLSALRSLLERLEREVGVQVITRTPTSFEDVRKQLARECRADLSEALNLFKFFIVGRNLRIVTAATRWLLANCNVLELENNFSKTNEEVAVQGGYRDIIAHVKYENLIYEFQVHLKSLFVMDEARNTMNIASLDFMCSSIKLSLLSRNLRLAKLLEHIVTCVNTLDNEALTQVRTDESKLTAPIQKILQMGSRHGFGEVHPPPTDAQWRDVVDYLIGNLNCPENIFALGWCLKYGEGIEKRQEDAFVLIDLAASQNYPLAQYSLGNCYSDGIGVAQNSEKGMALCRQAAENGCANAQVDLGDCYQLGKGVPKDLPTALNWFQLAVEQNSPRAFCHLGQCLEFANGVEKNETEAVRLYRRASDEGYPWGQYLLGECYQFGMGIERNDALALSLYKQALGFYDYTYCRLGMCYQFGSLGLTADAATAVRLYTVGAKKGNANSQHSLALCYDYGNGVAPDLVEAAKWYRMAADQGFRDAQTNLAVCYRLGQGVPKDDVEAIKLYKAAVAQGSACAQNNLAICYQAGSGVPHDMKESARLYRLAAEQKHVAAQVNLGTCYLTGEGVEQDMQEAIFWYLRAGEEKDARALYSLGVCFQFGRGVEKDEKVAVDYYRAAAAKHNYCAMYALGICELYGIGCAKSPVSGQDLIYASGINASTGG